MAVVKFTNDLSGEEVFLFIVKNYGKFKKSNQQTNWKVGFETRLNNQENQNE